MKKGVVCVVALIALTCVSAAWASGPRVGRWSGSGPGGTVYFVVSRVGGTDVLSDVVEQCTNGTPSVGDIPWSRNDQGPKFRSEAAIGADGRINDLFHVPGTGISADDYDMNGTLRGGGGTLTVHSGDGDQTCAIRNVHVSWIGGGTLADGDYRVSGGAPGTDLELSLFGEGAELWWSGLLGTPVGGVEDDPALCAEVEATALGAGDAFLGRNGRTVASHDVSALGAVVFSGHLIGRTHGVGGYVASSYPVCAGTGALAWTLTRHAPPLVPAVPLHGGSPPPPPPRRHRHRPPRTVRYVALGDSYSSGEGVRPYEHGTDTVRDRCHRSTRAYARLLARPGVVPGFRLRASFYACSGATTVKNVLSVPRYGERTQISRPLLRRAQLVTISIGGNDANFSKVLVQCSRVRSHCDEQQIAKTIQGLGGTLIDTYKQIRSRTGPTARIVVVGYPNLFPAKGCRKLRAVFSKKSLGILRRAGGVLDDTIAHAAAAAGVRFVDVRPAFADHEVCAKHEWIDFLVRPRARALTATIGSFHPNAAGQRAYARVLSGVLPQELR